MTLDQTARAFLKLGEFLRKSSDGIIECDLGKRLGKIISDEHLYNPWFTEENVRQSIRSIGESLKEEKLALWLEKYPKLDSNKQKKKIGVVTAGNLPLVGFHDFITVLISGNIFSGKLSSKDSRLLKFIADYLIETDRQFEKTINFYEDTSKDFDVVIATGSNNTSRYFEYYFGKYPHVFRKNRNSIGFLSGQETDSEFKLLGNDMFSYFGMGCRNVSKLFIPEGYSMDKLFENISHFEYLYKHNKYANNYDYNKSIYLMNQLPFYDNGFAIFRQDHSLSSPIAVINFQFYKNNNDVATYIELHKDQIQCIVSNFGFLENTIPFGQAQQPELWDYADNVDTMEFLLNL